ncbi:type I-F CRISPR-associated protein Csy2 [Psychrobacter sp. NPDC078370]|uniref:type I-F CRISPR-associated protein Csy2 n=1 Tax=Psychrobacter TaxID=497 RepID=UPI000C7ED5DC|nr:MULTISPECIES: type I-F CRISPR-associated protein Csy2 [Psychrobacter]PLT21911.1 type I-F CRISPR-associated protein Csy2 [Psychrobacter sp. MES7-P7E]|tara:strand:+ start:330 stop:1301 length:972 start_codon:yes stop_codon:yes gene_type:complete
MSRIDDDNDIGVIGYLLFKKVVINGANTISSPLTYGFPAITGFLGSFHAMSRKMADDEQLSNVSLGGVLLACHDCQPQMYRPNSYNNYTFNQTRNPIKKDGKTASIIEEGKCHLVMSFVVEVLADTQLTTEQQASVIQKTSQWIQQQRMAGGSVRGLARFEPVQYFDSSDISAVIPQLLPAFVLMDAQDEFAQIINDVQKDNPDAAPLDALIDVCALHHIPEAQKNGDTKWLTTSRKSGHGWLVPMPIGYQGISDRYDAGVMQNVRNPEYPSQYVEAIYSLGKWIYPQRLNRIGGEHDIVNAFWRYHYDADDSLYLVTQQQDF